MEVVFLKLIVVAMLVFASLWVLKIAIRNSPIRKSLKGRINQVLPLLEGIVWFGFLIWSIGQLIRNELWSSVGVLLIIFLVVVVLFWLLIRDYLAGIILRMDGSLKPNDWIRIKEIEGKITNLGSRIMEVTTASGETINIPYSVISGEISAKPNPAEKLINHSFSLKITKNADAENVIAQLREGILLAPWSSIIRTPEIKLVGEKPDYYQFEINLYSTKMVYFQKIKDALIRSLTNAGFQILD